MLKQQISMIGVPMDLGQLRRGVDMGPSAIRCAGVNERLECLCQDIEDLGDMTIGQREDEKEGGEPASEELRNLKAITKASVKLAETVDNIVASGAFPLVLGGDHSIAIGTLAGLAKHYQNLGVIWYDAHADLNTKETSPSGNIHGMPLAISLGIGHEGLTAIYGKEAKIKAENIVIIGARSLDDGEKELIRDKGIKVYTMHEIDRLGMTRVMEETIDYLRGRTDGVHLSLDLDALDPNDAPGVGTPVAGGISYRESHLAMEMLEESKLITSAEFVEVNPILDEKNRTAEAAVALMGSLFGEKLL
ncbi:arginase [Bacillus licheniformis]|jgi:arginase|uniref:Arginase n=4 Tax=Bacillus TaxID=1386 RepID=Q65P52_BACLD|nr:MULTISPECIES: arginase [Bacillus]MBJ7885905.1 arginase [Bacillaceae bacterium HSR45]MBY8348837.1 arginase [Bacillus sp. PCH94]MDP4081954.1 arginase [Bacillota bacterium]AAU21817.1 arginase [Bacillus licheniformis DSM 13 = ATCC 14580]AAU39162.1 arginase RocF [Bacillus licheniformis DSM 13 = ATCC 14580]